MIAVAGNWVARRPDLHSWRNGIGDFPDIRERHLVPLPPYGQGRAAAEAGALAMTDVSDGLLADPGTWPSPRGW